MWIDASDDIPMYGQKVLVLCDYDGHTEYNIGCYKHEKWWNVIEGTSHIPVTHWMPLPAPPAPKKSCKPEYRNCRDCDYWRSGGGTITRVCDFPRSPNFLEHTEGDDGCTPRKKARADWL